MAARRHEISLRVFFTLIVFWCERRDLLCIHSNSDIFTCEDNTLFSHVKISSFRAKAHLVFHWCLYNNIIYLFIYCRKRLDSLTPLESKFSFFPSSNPPSPFLRLGGC